MFICSTLIIDIEAIFMDCVITLSLTGSIINMYLYVLYSDAHRTPTKWMNLMNTLSIDPSKYIHTQNPNTTAVTTSMKINIVIDIPNRNIGSYEEILEFCYFLIIICAILNSVVATKIIQSKSFKSIMCTIVKQRSQNVQHNYHKLYNPSLYLSIESRESRVELWLKWFSDIWICFDFFI